MQTQPLPLNYYKEIAMNPKSPPISPLHEDLVTSILLHLPLKSIARFESVSKQWLSLVATTPQFSLPKPTNSLISHSSNTNHKPQLFSLNHDATMHGASLTRRGCASTHSCNGLLLCCLRSDEPWLFKLFVSNPTTGRYATLDLHYPISYNFLSLAAYLAFDPSSSPRYHVVCFCTAEWYDTRVRVMIYSSESSTWRLVRASLPSPQPLRGYGGGVFWNGSIYWASQPHEPMRLDNWDKRELYRFDVEGERIEQVVVTCSSDDEHVIYLGPCRGRLYVVKGVYDCDGKIRVLNVYSIEKGSEWRLENVVPWPFERRRDEVKLMFFDSGERCLYFRVGKMVARYDLEARTSVEIFEHEDVGFGTSYSQHMEILYSAGLTHIGHI